MLFHLAHSEKKFLLLYVYKQGDAEKKRNMHGYCRYFLSCSVMVFGEPCTVDNTGTI